MIHKIATLARPDNPGRSFGRASKPSPVMTLFRPHMHYMQKGTKNRKNLSFCCESLPYSGQRRPQPRSFGRGSSWSLAYLPDLLLLLLLPGKHCQLLSTTTFGISDLIFWGKFASLGPEQSYPAEQASICEQVCLSVAKYWSQEKAELKYVNSITSE